MNTDGLLFLLASDWFVVHAEAIGLLPGLDQDAIEAVSVAARTPIQRLMAQAESYYQVSFEETRIAASAQEFLGGLRRERRVCTTATLLLARYAALDETDFNRMWAWYLTTRVDGNDRYLPVEALALRNRLDAIADARVACFTSWDESLDRFRECNADDSQLLADFGAMIVPWRLLETALAHGGFAERAWQDFTASAHGLGMPRSMTSTMALVARGLPKR